MELDRAKEIIRSLADGRDPATGQQFPPESPYQQADTVRALYMALESLEKGGRTRAPRVVDPNKPKAGGAWTPEEEQQLRDAFAARQPIRDMAQAHGRTPGAITSRLVKLGLIEDDHRNRPGQGNRPRQVESTSPSRHLVTPEHPRVGGSPDSFRRSETMPDTPPPPGTQEVPPNCPF